MNYGKIIALILGLILAYFHFTSPEQGRRTSLPHPHPKIERQGKTNHQTVIAPAEWQKALVYAQEHLPHEGTLVTKSDGFTYLKVDDRYVNALFPLLNLNHGFKEPPYFRFPEAPGAHISVFYSDEKIKPSEIGQTYPFKLKKIVMVHPSRKSRYVVLEVESSELENLRKKYGLSPLLKNHAFHISIAKKTYTQPVRFFDKRSFDTSPKKKSKT